MDHSNVKELCVNCAQPLAPKNKIIEGSNGVARTVGCVLSLIYKLSDVQEFDREAAVCCSQCSAALESLYFEYLNFESLRQLGSHLSQILSTELEQEITFDENSSPVYSPPERQTHHQPFVKLERLKESEISTALHPKRTQNNNNKNQTRKKKMKMNEPRKGENSELDMLKQELSDDDCGEDNDYVCNNESDSDDSTPDEDPLAISDSVKIPRRTKSSFQKSSLEKSPKKSPRQLTCLHCGEICKSRRFHNAHVRSVHNADPYQCNLCSTALPTRGELLDHHKDEHELRLPSNGKKFSIKCLHCGKVFNSSRVHNTHVRNVHNADPRQCNLCSTTFPTRLKLLDHQKDDHELRRPSNGPKFSIKCIHCGEVFNSRRVHNTHVQNIHNADPHQCNLCPMTFPTRRKLLDHQKNHQEHLTCSACSQSFTYFKLLKEHFVSIHPDQCRQCPKCSKLIYLERRYQHHLILCGTVTQCDLCSMTFSNKWTYIAHKKAVHEGVKAHLCNVCGEKFARAGTLNIHMRRHTEEKPYQCDICLKRFRHNSALTQHKNMHTKSKSYLCTFCGMSFLRRDNFQRHSQTHSDLRPFKCEVEGCESAFKCKSTLATHAKVHAEGKTTRKGRGIARKTVGTLEEIFH